MEQKLNALALEWPEVDTVRLYIRIDTLGNFSADSIVPQVPEAFKQKTDSILSGFHVQPVRNAYQTPELYLTVPVITVP